MVTEDTWFYIRAYSHYEDKMLPFGGGWFEQPGNYIDAMERLRRDFGQIKRDIEKQAAERARRESQLARNLTR